MLESDQSQQHVQINTHKQGSIGFWQKTRRRTMPGRRDVTEAELVQECARVRESARELRYRLAADANYMPFHLQRVLRVYIYRVHRLRAACRPPRAFLCAVTNVYTAAARYATQKQQSPSVTSRVPSQIAIQLIRIDSVQF